MSTGAFSDRLLDWWDEHGRKDLPWQHPRTPYRVWLSEIMLQQTQVATVIPYFERFVHQFPEIPELASAPLDEVLALWSGLGYYARARNLHKAAKVCIQEYGGELPRTAELLETLPGIGMSTANAIVSQAHDEPAVILDGNVRRVMARHGMIEGWYGKKQVADELWQAAKERLPQKRGADYSQAIMDLGATLCTQRAPSCDRCPVSVDCSAHRTGRVHELPSPKPKTKVRERDVYMLVHTNDQHQILLEKRPDAGIWGGLWSLPEAGSREKLAARAMLNQSQLKKAEPLHHRLSHQALTIYPCFAHGVSSSDQVREASKQQWLSLEDALQLGLPKPVRQILEQSIGDKP